MEQSELVKMPSGKTHDSITFILAVPTFLITWRVMQSATLAAFVTVAFLFGGLMFGPDLDTNSTEYKRWGVLRILWFPYKVAMPHRSRWSHGLIFGTIIRIVYFAGAITVFTALGFYVYATLKGGTPPNVEQIQTIWREIGMWTRDNIGNYALLAILAGLWLGAASHTFADSCGTFLKTGRFDKYL
ncbi:MAG: metal-binding protein [Pyrinomonadaceae bacterium]|nr:metal-binding protein [Pyrinomonadaceae bacterium]